jgi:hypothetical protein
MQQMIKRTRRAGLMKAGAGEPPRALTRHTNMRVATMPGATAALVAIMAAGGCAAVRTGPGGAWTACGNVARVTAVQVRRDPLWVPLPPANPSVAAVRRLYHDFCAIAGHPTDMAPGDIAGGTPLYLGVFYAGDRQLATFSYESGHLGLFIGPAQVQTSIAGSAAAAAPSVDADFAAVLGLSPDAVDNPPRQPPPRLPLPRLTVASTAAVAGRPGQIAVISGIARCSGGEQATLGISLSETSASLPSGGTFVTIACDGRRRDWSAAIRVSFPEGTQGPYWTAPGHGEVTLYLNDPGGPLDFYEGPLARPVSRDISFVMTRRASRHPPQPRH